MGLEYKSETYAVDLPLSNVVPAKPLTARVTMNATRFPNRSKIPLVLGKITPNYRILAQ